MRRLIVTVALVAAVGQASASLPPGAFRAMNGMWVIPQTPGTFAVAWNGQSGAPVFWCAAGDYVSRGLGLPDGTRIWRLSEPPRRAGEAIRFSLSADGAASRTGIIAFFGQTPANNFSAVGATSLCDRLSGR